MEKNGGKRIQAREVDQLGGSQGPAQDRASWQENVTKSLMRLMAWRIN